jgi:DNA-binding response OmpR family regulator
VDGDTYHRSYHIMILQRFEFRAIAAATAGEALQSIEAPRPSLVLMELDLPDMIGFDLLRRLHRDRGAAVVPVDPLIKRDLRVCG